MTPRQLILPQSRAPLFDPPTDLALIVRHYTFLPEDLTLIQQRRREANRLGFAVHLAYLRFPGRVLGADEMPPADILAFVAGQLGIDDINAFKDYAQRGETRREHLGELQAYLHVRPFGREDYRVIARIALEEATGTDRGDAIVAAMIAYLQERRILLPPLFGSAGASAQASAQGVDRRSQERMS